MKTQIIKLKNQVPPAPVKDMEAQLKEPREGNPLAVFYCNNTEVRRQGRHSNETGKSLFGLAGTGMFENIVAQFIGHPVPVNQSTTKIWGEGFLGKPRQI